MVAKPPVYDPQGLGAGQGTAPGPRAPESNTSAVQRIFPVNPKTWEGTTRGEKTNGHQEGAHYWGKDPLQGRRAALRQTRLFRVRRLRASGARATRVPDRNQRLRRSEASSRDATKGSASATPLDRHKAPAPNQNRSTNPSSSSDKPTGTPTAASPPARWWKDPPQGPPHPRGSTVLPHVTAGSPAGFPTYEGMFPEGEPSKEVQDRFPHIRGDVPIVGAGRPWKRWGSPTYEGMLRGLWRRSLPCSGFPHIRGDTPAVRGQGSLTCSVPPPPRAVAILSSSASPYPSQPTLETPRRTRRRQHENPPRKTPRPGMPPKPRQTAGPSPTPPWRETGSGNGPSMTGPEAKLRNAWSTTASTHRNAGGKSRNWAYARAARTPPNRARPAAPPAPRNTTSPTGASGPSRGTWLKMLKRRSSQLSQHAGRP